MSCHVIFSYFLVSFRMHLFISSASFVGGCSISLSIQLFARPSSFKTQNQVHKISFLDASSHLYKRVCPSVGPLVRWSVRWSVGMSRVCEKCMKQRILCTEMINKAYKVMNNIKTALQHIYHQRWLLPYSDFLLASLSSL